MQSILVSAQGRVKTLGSAPDTCSMLVAVECFPRVCTETALALASRVAREGGICQKSSRISPGSQRVPAIAQLLGRD